MCSFSNAQQVLFANQDMLFHQVISALGSPLQTVILPPPFCCMNSATQVHSPSLGGDLVVQRAGARFGLRVVLGVPVRPGGGAGGGLPAVAEARQQLVEGLAEVVRQEGVEDRVHAAETIKNAFRRILQVSFSARECTAKRS